MIISIARNNVIMSERWPLIMIITDRAIFFQHQNYSGTDPFPIVVMSQRGQITKAD